MRGIMLLSMKYDEINEVKINSAKVKCNETAVM